MAQLFAPHYHTILDANGDPVSGGKAYFYATGTTTLASVYTTSALNVAHQSPVVADSAGRLPAIYLDPLVAYRIKEYDASDVLIRDTDPLTQNSATSQSYSPGGSTQTRTVASALDEFVFASSHPGYDPTGATDSYAAIVAMDAYARSVNRELRIQGVPKIASTIILNNPTRWKFEGTHFKPGFTEQGSYIQKASSLNGPAVVIGPDGYGTVLEGGGLIGAAGNLGDGLVIWGNQVTVRDFSIESMGRDGIRIGRYASGDAYASVMSGLSGTFNADSFFLDGIASGYNTGHGMVLHDGVAAGGFDANAGCIERPVLVNNTLSGLYADNTFLGSEIVAGLFESNGRYGIELFTNAVLNFRGGDVEANTLGQILEANVGASIFDHVSVGGVVWHSRLRGGSWTPVISGATSAGAGTYTLQKGRFSIAGSRLFFDIKITWTAHTGTGQMVVSLPTGFLPDVNWSSAGKPDQTPVLTLNNGVTMGAGTRLGALVSAGAQRIELGTISTTDAYAALNVPATGGFILSGSYELADAVERL